MGDNAPKRKYQLLLEVEADDIDSLDQALVSIQFWLVAHYTSGNTNGVSGGYSSGWTYDLKVDETMTHERYIVALNDYIKRLKR